MRSQLMCSPPDWVHVCSQTGNKMITHENIPKPPTHLGKAGRAYWSKVTRGYDLDESHLPLLEAAAAQLDRAATARELVKKHGVTVTVKGGIPKENAACAVERAAYLAFLRLNRELGLDLDLPEVRGPRRLGTGRG